MSSTFKFTLVVPRQIRLPVQSSNQRMDRESFYEWVWSQFTPDGLIGVHEGTVLSEEAAEAGFETDSWTVDSGEAPRERDWIDRQEEVKTELYFSTQEGAAHALEFLKSQGLEISGSVEEQKPQDWDAEWKASFLNAGQGVLIPPFWKVVPPWVDATSTPQERILKVNPGAGFGTGTHETTQLCLQAMGEAALKRPLSGCNALDFGSGSGILSIGLALLGAQVDGVEIDPLANDNARENAQINQVEARILFSERLPEKGKVYSVVVANILKPVLLEFSEELISRLSPEGVLILSGLIEKDVEPVKGRFSSLRKFSSIRVEEKNEWRAIVFE